MTWRLSAKSFPRELRKSTVFLFLLNFFGLFAWWGLFTWIPTYLALPVDKGGRGFGLLQTTTFLVVLNLVGMFPGYVSFGWIAERFGRKRSLMLYLFCAAVISSHLCGGPIILGHYDFGHNRGIFRDRIFFRFRTDRQRTLPYPCPRPSLRFHIQWRADPQCASTLYDWQVGAKPGIFPGHFLFSAIAFLLATVMASQLPETKGKNLE